uniref:7TM_GPCR_Srx domain-containing protein n=1 Tax=Caenorhabditis tropicalis TaxID=1561998 RepID=A0A1I7U1I7_9PELO
MGFLDEFSSSETATPSMRTAAAILLILVTSPDPSKPRPFLQPDPSVSTAQLLQRHRKNRRMIIQALVQSFLIIVDSLNSTVTYGMFPTLFFQFLTLSFSMVFLRTVEGFVVFSINNTVNSEVKKMLGRRPSVKVTFVPNKSNSVRMI